MVGQPTVDEEVAFVVLQDGILVDELLQEGSRAEIVDDALGEMLVNRLQIVAARLLGQSQILLKGPRETGVKQTRRLRGPERLFVGTGFVGFCAQGSEKVVVGLMMVRSERLERCHAVSMGLDT